MYPPPDRFDIYPESEPMDELTKTKILSMSRSAHHLTEVFYQQDHSKKGDAGWVDKERILLADMALHLIQTTLQNDEISTEDLKRNLFSILVISDQLMPGHDLKAVADEFYSS